MSLGKRLLNVARAELKSAAGKVRETASDLFQGHHDEEAETPHDDGPKREPDREPPRRKSSVGEPADVRRYYANLELPIGSSADEVRAAYRRLMRRYHPDRHQHDPARVETANQLARELRVAYEGLLAHLGEK